VKARKVKGLDPAAPLADNAERIVRVRLDELCSFMPQASDPAEVVALHDMRIAAKRLRYILEITGPCFGPYAVTAVKATKDIQDLLGEIHDCDVQLPEVQAFHNELAAAGVDDASPGLMALVAQLRARRELLFGRFLELWLDHQRKGYRARLEFAVGERADATISAE
jgi:CHAD domain-containing protein